MSLRLTSIKVEQIGWQYRVESTVDFAASLVRPQGSSALSEYHRKRILFLPLTTVNFQDNCSVALHVFPYFTFAFPHVVG
jgi:hypothetical protein